MASISTNPGREAVAFFRALSDLVITHKPWSNERDFVFWAAESGSVAELHAPLTQQIRSVLPDDQVDALSNAFPHRQGSWKHDAVDNFSLGVREYCDAIESGDAVPKELSALLLEMAKAMARNDKAKTILLGRQVLDKAGLGNTGLFTQSDGDL
jgi:hypothetical protein